MKKVISVLAVMIVLGIFAFPALGAIDARAAAMGGAYTAIAQGYSAAYWNPAGITQTGFISAGLSLGVIGSMDDFSELNDFFNGTTIPPDVDVGMDAMLGVSTKILGLSYVTRGILRSDGSTSADGTMRNDLVFTYGGELVDLPMSIANLSYGINIKLINEKTVTYSPGRSESTADDYAFDLGVMFKLTDLLKLGATYNDIGYDSNWRIGVAGFVPVIDITFAGDLEESGSDILMHAGLEKGFGPIAFRVGGFTTPGGDLAYAGGIGIRAVAVFIDLAYVQDPIYESQLLLSAGIKL